MDENFIARANGDITVKLDMGGETFKSIHNAHRTHHIFMDIFEKR
jgi:hypothetical protein